MSVNMYIQFVVMFEDEERTLAGAEEDVDCSTEMTALLFPSI